MGRFLERIKQSGVGRFYAKYSADRADEGAILVAWQALFSLFPMLVGMLAILGLVVRNEEARGAVTDAVAGAFPEQAGDLVSFIEETRELGGPLAIVGLLGLLWTGSALFGQMGVVFNRFYDAPERGFIGQRVMAFGMMAVYLVLIVVSVAANGAGHAIADLAEWVLGFPLSGLAAVAGLVIGWLLSLGSAFLMFLVLFRVVPNVSLSFRDVWRGAALSAVLFLILNQIFPIYLQFFGGGFAAYKTFGLFLLLMTWFFFLTRILVLGCELNAFLSGHGSTQAAMPGVPRQQQRQRAGAARVGVNGRAAIPPAGKQVLWAALSAGVTGLVLAGAQRTAASMWRTLMREEPPSKGG